MSHNPQKVTPEFTSAAKFQWNIGYNRRDVLVLTLKTMKIGEEFECTKGCYRRINERLQEFLRLNVSYKYMVREWAGMTHVRRVA